MGKNKKKKTPEKKATAAVPQPREDPAATAAVSQPAELQQLETEVRELGKFSSDI